MLNPKIKQIAKNAAFEAGEELLKRFKKFHRKQTSLKSKHEILTQADIQAEKIILENIKQDFPDHRILSEEAGDNDKDSDYLWIIDPLDGTTNFSIHNPLWAVSISLLYKNQVKLGVIYAPFLEELYFAEKGKGATRNKTKIKVSDNETTKNIHAFCHGSDQKDIKKAIKYYRYQKLNNLDCRQLGSASLELAYVASGRLESITIPGANSWDVAAGVLLVQEAGGKVTDFNNKKWNLQSKDMIASNKKTHSQILQAL